MNHHVSIFSLLAGLWLLTSAFMPADNTFTAAEQQQISIPTPGIFSRSNAFSIDLSQYGIGEYSFPLPVGKAELKGNGSLEITTAKGDAVKAMFEGVVRLARKVPGYGNVVVVRHNNGLETVYGNNVQNLVKVGQRVKAGQTLAIVGERDGRGFCEWSVMVNGGRINPETILDIKNHKLLRETIVCRKSGEHVNVSSKGRQTKDEKNVPGATALAANETAKKAVNTASDLDLTLLRKSEWAYPLPGSHIISPYGGARHHAGVDLKTRANDNIVAAFDGVVTRSCVYFGYGNCIVIKHDNGLETLYSHQSRNHVKVGQRVKAGDVIGLTGRTGRATTEHLHFEVRYKGVRIDPKVVFDHANKSLQQVTLVCRGGRVHSERNYFAQSKK